MKRMVLGWLVAGAVVLGSASAGVNQWTPAGPDGGSFRAVRYLGNGVALAVSMRSIYRTANHGVTWTRVGDLYGNLNGVGTSIAVNPANPAQIIVMGFTAIYCSNDGGLTFTQVNDIVPGVSVNSIQPHAVSFSRTGGAAWIAALDGTIYRSMDGGLTWSPRSNGIPLNTWIYQLETGAAGSAVEYAQTNGSAYSTTDGGLIWNPITMPVAMQRLAISPKVPGTLLAMSNGAQPYLSTNFGTSWTIGGAAQVYSVKYDPVTVGRAYAISYDYDFVRTNNDAATWTVRSRLPITSPLDFDIDASDTQRVLAASNATLIGSTDGGVNWTERVDGIHETGINRFVVSRGAASALYAPTYGLHRAYRRDAATGAWNSIPTLPVVVFSNLYGSSALTASPVDGNILYMAVGGVFGRSINGGATWTSIGTLPDDIASLIWDPSNELIGYAISANQGAMKTIDGGAHWTLSGTGLPRIQSLVVDPSNSSNLFATADVGFAGTVAVYRSTNGGANWSPSANGVTQTFGWTLAFEPGNSAVLYLGTSGGFYKTTNSGASWTAVTLNPGITPNVFGISIDPNNTNIVYVMDTAYPSAPSRTVDGGATWESLRMPDYGTNNYPIYLTLVPGRRSLLAGAIYNGGIHEMEIAPDLEVSTSAGGPLAVGVPRTLLIRSRNLGTYAATAGRLAVTLPEAAAGYTVTDNGHGCVLAGRQLTCTLGIVRAGATADISVAFTPVTPGESLTAQLSAYEPDSAQSNNSITVATERRADVRVALASSVTAPATETLYAYTLAVTNDGPSAAASVVATLQLPANVTFASTTASGLTCARNAQTVTCNAATLAANASASAVVTVEANTTGTAAASVSVVSTGTDPQLANNSASNTVTIERRADVRAALASSVTVPLMGERYDYTLTVTNDGPSQAASVVATLLLPANVTFVSTTASGLTCARNAQTVTCNAATLAVNASASAVVSVDATTAGAALATVSVASTGTDPQLTNNSASNTVTVERRADVRVALASSVTARLTGERFDYTLSVTNDGPNEAASVVATLLLPANVTYVSTTASGLICARNAQTVTCNAATLAVNASANAAVSVDAATAGAALATVSVASTGADPQLTNNSASSTVTVTAPVPAPTPTPPGTSSSGGGGGGGGGRLDYLLLAFLLFTLYGRRRFDGVFRRGC